ncbi:MAG TPA: hypothetical protein VMN57_01315 [Anaerolineales bacterium]|nr:hypothetical protein [Anaerolineales bacterium]
METKPVNELSILILGLGVVFFLGLVILFQGVPDVAAGEETVVMQSSQALWSRDSAAKGDFSLFIPRVSNCTILYFDDFENPNSGWPVVDDGNIALFGYLNGEYRIRFLASSVRGGAHPGLSFDEYVLTVDLRNVNNLNGSYGLLYGFVDSTHFYTFEIDKDQNYVAKQFDGSLGSWSTFMQDKSEHINPGTASNTIAVMRRGSGISLFVNGVWIDSATRDEFVGELRVGLWVFGGDQENLDIRFDNFKVEPLGCGLGDDALLSLPVDERISPPVHAPTSGEGQTWVEVDGQESTD